MTTSISAPCCDDCVERKDASLGLASEPDAAEPREGSSFAEVWRQVRSDPYALPFHRVTLASFFASMSNRLGAAARRTLADDRDILPHFDKLIRPNGICLCGTWKITEPSPYSGYFARGQQALLIARASVALSGTRRGQYRSFGMAGKLFPTLQQDKAIKTANFFVIDDNGGTRAKHYLDTELLTRAKLSINPSSLLHLPILLAVTLAQRMADAHSELRQLYPIAEIGSTPAATVTPRYMMIAADTGQRVDADDFREELRVAHYGGVLPLSIFVRDDQRRPWIRLGGIELTDDVVSASCDHRLHFSHPRWKPVTS